MKVYYDGTPKGYSCIDMGNGPRIRSNINILTSVSLPENFIGTRSNQRAEYVALIYALQSIKSYTEYTLLGDCENVVFQMLGINKIKDHHLRQLNEIANAIIQLRGLQVNFDHVDRDNNPAGRYLEKYMKRR